MKHFMMLLSGCLYLASPVYARQITVNPLPIKDQLPANSVRRVLQDSNGFLWLGTSEGLCRYDGYRVSVFRSDHNNPLSLPGNDIMCLSEDLGKNLWIGTTDGLCMMHPDTFRFEPFHVPELRGRRVEVLLCSSDGKVWAGVEGRIYRYDPKTMTVEDLSDKIAPNGHGINHIYEDRFGDVWILIWKGGMYRCKKDGSVVRYPPVGTTDTPFHLYQDDKNRYWLCTWDNGLFRFTPDAKPGSMYTPCPVYDRQNQSEKSLFGIVQDDMFGYLWLMSQSGIMALKCAEDESVTQIDVSYLFRESNNVYSEIIKDSKGNLWVGTFDEGVFSINFDKPDIENMPLDAIRSQLGVSPNITLIHKDSDGLLWLNQNRKGLCLYDPATNRIRNFRDIPALEETEFLSWISAIEDCDSELYVGAGESSEIGVLEKRNGQPKLKRIVDLNSLLVEPLASKILDIFRDSRGNLWIVTNHPVFIKPYNSETIELFSLDLDAVTDVTEDMGGSIWMSSGSNGIYRIDVDTTCNAPSGYGTVNIRKDQNGLPGSRITSLCCDLEGNIWFGTKDGNILSYDPSKEIFEDRTRSFNMNGEVVYDILSDRCGSIWATTNKRVIEYNRETGAMKDYSLSDGIVVDSFSPHACFFDVDGNRLYFGGNNGICVLSPSVFDIESDKGKESHAIVSDVKVYGRSLLTDPDNDRFRIISQKLTLEPGDRNVEIEFTTLDYTNAGKILYAYRMDGIDADWNYTDRRFVTYNRLTKGKHTFQIKATDENRIWNSNISSFEIYKAPAFYETWWAYIIYTLLAAGVVSWTYRIGKNKIKLRQELLIAQIEKDKSEELAQTKLRYFTNISHDLLTPLTIISCLIDDVETEFNEKPPQFEIMRANTGRLRRLLQQVLDFRKIESGNMRLRVAQGDLSAFVRDVCLNNFTPLLEKKRIGFAFTSEPTQITGLFDADKIDKIVHNLVSNALKYTSGEGRVHVSLELLRQDGIRYVSIAVGDTGKGIAPGQIGEIFTRFYNNRDMDADLTNGIGLSLTRDLVELHHGTIAVESTVGQGSVFTVTIPIDMSEFTDTELDSRPSQLSTSETNDTNVADRYDATASKEDPKKGDVNLLLVEDNEDILYTLKNTLKKRYNVITATNGEIALDIVRNNDVDIIISDIMMPEMDGLELCRLVKSDIETSHISILLLTAKNSVEDRIECYDVGADGYISKPFDIKLVQARVNNFVTKRKRMQAEFKSNAVINVSTLDYSSRDEEFLKRAVLTIEKSIDDINFDLNNFAEGMNMSKSSLYRKIKTMIGLSPNEFIRNIRLKHACRMLRDKQVNISEVAYAVGFTDPRYFATCFKTAFGTTPSEYQKNDMPLRKTNP